jgi:hypothetical protein
VTVAESAESFDNCQSSSTNYGPGANNVPLPPVRYIILKAQGEQTPCVLFYMIWGKITTNNSLQWIVYGKAFMEKA